MSKILRDQNKVLFFTSFTEFGERYSYYIIQALLIFFLLDHFHISEANASSLVGTALGMIYISAIFGGYIADKLIGHYRAARLGSILLCIGSILLAVCSSQNILFLGLAFISISSGLIKSNMSSFLGDFYNKSSLAEGYRDYGFSIFYVGINLGSLFALFLASLLKSHFGFTVPFYTSVGVAIVVFINLCIGSFVLHTYTTHNKLKLLPILKSAAVICSYIVLVFINLKFAAVATTTIFIACLLCASIIFRSTSRHNAKNISVIVLFFVLSTLYWSVYFQEFISILVYIDRAVDPHIFSFDLASSQFLAIESLSVVIIGPVMARIWLYFGKVNRSVHDIDKFNLGFIFMAIALIIFYVSIAFTPLGAKTAAFPIILFQIIVAISELCLSANGLSMITKLAPKNYISLYMGIWLVTLGVGGKIGGFLSSLLNIDSNIVTAQKQMSQGLLIFLALTILGSIFCFRLRKIVIARSATQ